jgi:hypothetical protein
MAMWAVRLMDLVCRMAAPEPALSDRLAQAAAKPAQPRPQALGRSSHRWMPLDGQQYSALSRSPSNFNNRTRPDSACSPVTDTV